MKIPEGQINIKIDLVWLVVTDRLIDAIKPVIDDFTTYMK
jgi:hypothetical protein